MYEVILYAAIATIVCAMLYSVLGRSVGRGPESGFDPSNFLQGKDEEKCPKCMQNAILKYTHALFVNDGTVEDRKASKQFIVPSGCAWQNSYYPSYRGNTCPNIP